MKTFENDCETVLEIARLASAGIAPNPSESVSMYAHLETCATCVAAAALIRANALTAAPLREMDELSRHRYIDSILEAAATPEVVSAPASKRRRVFAAGIAAGIAAVFAVLVGAIFLLRDNSPAKQPPKSAARPLPKAAAPPVDIHSAPAVIADNRFTSQSMPSVISLPTEIKILLEPEGKLVLERVDRTAIQVRLIEGDLLAEVSPSRRGPKFQVATAIGTVSVTGTVFNVQVSGDSATVYVLRGAVEVATERNTQTVHAGEGFSLDKCTVLPLSSETRARLTEHLARLRDGNTETHMRVDLRHLLPDTTASRRPVSPLKAGAGENVPMEMPTVEALLNEANAARLQKHWDAATALYEELLRLYPEEPAAVHAKAALGNLLLDKLDHPKQALEYFNQYLAKDNLPLAEEALYGKARALKALGRFAEEKASLLVFVERFPNAVKRGDAEERLRALENKTLSNTDESP